MTRALVVLLESDLPTFRANGIVHAIATMLPGVQSVANLEAITRETLDVLLLKPEPELQKAPTHKRYQLELFGESAA